MKLRCIPFVAWLAAPVPAYAAEPQEKAEVFGPTVLHAVHVTVAAKAYAGMDPPPNANPFGAPGGAGRPAVNPADAGAGNFGFDFPVVRAAVRVGDQAFPDVALRYKGSGTYLTSMRGAKRSFKVEFDKGERLGDLKKLNLNSGVMDPTKVREALAYSVYRAAGVPACRTAFAEVTLTVPGKYENEYLGLYTAVEQVDKAFLARHFKKGSGLLLKPEGIRGVPFLGDDPAAYEKPFNVKSDADPEGMKRLVAFTKLVNRADEATFRKDIGTFLYVPSFTRFLAASVMLASLDGFIGMGHNYYLYLNPESNKFVFLPWDLDLSFGGFFIFGQPEQQAELSLDRPYQGENKLIERLLAMPDVKAMYREHIRRLAEEVFTAAALVKEIGTAEALAREPLAKEKKAADARREGGGFGFGMPGMGGPALALTGWVEKRAKSALAQLDGKGRGFVPQAGGFGGPPGGGFGGPPGGFGPGNQLSRPLLDRLDANKDGRVTEAEFSEGMRRLFKEWDTNGSGSLDQKKIADGLQKLVPPPGGGR